MRHHGAFAYITGELANGTTLPLFRLRYNGSASNWGFAIYRASRDGYEDSILPSTAPRSPPTSRCSAEDARPSPTRTHYSRQSMGRPPPMCRPTSRRSSPRTAELLSYQDATYAREYAEFVAKTQTAKEAATPGATDLTEAVATNLYKLMAYKDEYEVARLILDETFDATIRAEFGQDATYKVRLHPPILRTMGLKRKIALGRRWRPLFRLLHAMRRLRGTRLDVFGYHPVRRMERQLITEYRHEIEQLLPHLTPHTTATATKLAALPDMIRGYEQIKIANVRDYRTELARLRDELTTYHPATT